MSTANDLTNVLFGRTRSGVLALLYGHPDKSFYTRQIARELHASTGAVQRELENLARVGLIARSSLGNQVFYKANPQTPVFTEMRALVNKTVGAFGILQSALRPLSTRIAVAFVYGSMARQEEKAESDIDLMIVGKVTLEVVLTRLGNIESALGRAVNPTVYSPAEFKSKLGERNHFLTSVLRGQKVFLIGDEDELGKVGGIRLAESRANQSR
jgi:uncharacterized protein